MPFSLPIPLRAALGACFLLIAAGLVALLLLAGSAIASGGRCKSGTQPWKVNGHTLCLKTVKPRAGHSAIETSARLSRWFDQLSTKPMRKRLKVPARLWTARKRARAQALSLLARAEDFGSHARRQRLAAATAAAAGRGAVVDTMSEDSAPVTTDQGVEVSSHIDGRAFEDGSKQFNFYVEMKKDGDSVRWIPYVDSRSAVVPEVNCPTAEGLLTIDYGFSTGGTMQFFKRGKLIGGVTQKTSETLHAVGHVGRDARLHDVTSQVSEKNEQYTRGLQLVTTVSGTYTISRDGDPVRQGPLDADVSVKAAGAGRAQERAAELQAAANLAADPAESNSLGAQAEIGRWRMKGDEYKWYSLPNACTDLRYDPSSIATLAPGASAQVKAVVRATAGGGEASGELTDVNVTRGSLSVTKKSLDPGSPALLSAKATDPDADHNTVGSDIIATSTAGRAQWGWYANWELDLPQKLTGTISSTTTIPGAKNDSFHATVVYTLDTVSVSPDGYVDAFYTLTEADQDQLKNEIGSGCRWVAEGSGGTIAAGDLELRRAPGEGFKYAPMYDVEIENTTFTPTDCGPTPPPAFTGTAVGFLNMALLGGGFLDVGANFHLAVSGKSYTDVASGRTTSASWTLDPATP